eukprot:scaffold2028_cov191-Amphora_coffeaeformis.AAC.7
MGWRFPGLYSSSCADSTRGDGSIPAQSFPTIPTASKYLGSYVGEREYHRRRLCSSAATKTSFLDTLTVYCSPPKRNADHDCERPFNSWIERVSNDRPNDTHSAFADTVKDLTTIPHFLNTV